MSGVHAGSRVDHSNAAGVAKNKQLDGECSYQVDPCVSSVWGSYVSCCTRCFDRLVNGWDSVAGRRELLHLQLSSIRHTVERAIK